MPNRHHTPIAAGLAVFSVLVLAASLVAAQTFVGTTSNDFGPQMIANSPTDTGIWVEADANGSLKVVPGSGSLQDVNITKVGGSVVSATVALPVRLTDGAAFYAGATETTAAAMSAKLPASVGAKTGAASLSVVPNTDTAFPVTGTFWQATQPVSGTFWQATQPVSGTFWQATQPVSGTFWQATQPVSAASLPLPTGAATSALQGAGLPAALGAGGGVKIDGSGTALPVSGTFWQATQPISGSVTATVASTTLTATVHPAAGTVETSALGFQVGIAATLMGTATAGRKALQIHNPGGSGRSIYCGVSNAVTATNANSIWEIEAGQNWQEPFPTATTIYCIAALATYSSWTQLF